MSSRRKSREMALQFIFQEDFTGSSPDEILKIFLKGNVVSLKNRKFAEFLFRQYLENRIYIDKLISSHSQNWKLKRMSVVDRSILRMALSEFLYTDTPKVVIIDEAIEIARRYSGDESTEFINGVLDAMKQTLKPEGTEERMDDRRQD